MKSYGIPIKEISTAQKLLKFAEKCRPMMVASVLLAIIGVLCGPHGVTAIVGPPGGGKSTLTKLMAGFYRSDFIMLMTSVLLIVWAVMLETGFVRLSETWYRGSFSTPTGFC